jgi:hypothetical protein
VYQKQSVAQSFTHEILSNIAGFLAGDNAFYTLACMLVANRSMQLITAPVLYETVVLDGDCSKLRVAEGILSNSGNRSHTK